MWISPYIGSLLGQGAIETTRFKGHAPTHLKEDSMNKQRFGEVILVFALFGSIAVKGQVLTATVTGGQVEGVLSNGISTFKGIPFAAPPVGDLRWKAPQPLLPWNGVKKASKFGPICMSDPKASAIFGGPLEVSEDCLYLNVWSPAKTASEKLPVMVWIYGGGFASGDTSSPLYDGARLAEKGVVMVSIAYRIGAFGFLAHPDLDRESGEGSGNYGLRDQIAGLKWVKDNIASFGGDPSRVTIFGESAGGIAVSILAASPAAKGLFARAISESGGNFAPPVFDKEGGQSLLSQEVAENRGKDFLAKLGAADIKIARALPADTIVKGEEGSGPGQGFWPDVDGKVVVGDQYELFEAARFNDVPVLIGWNTDEGALFVRGDVAPAQFESLVRSGYGEYADKLLAVFPHKTNEEAKLSEKWLFRDSWFGWGTWTWAKLQTQHGKGKVFLYNFDFHGPEQPDGPSHGAEMAYVFGNLEGVGAMLSSIKGAPSKEEITVSENLSNYWVNFAKTGDPNGPGLPKWPTFSAASPEAMHLHAQPSAGPIAGQQELQTLDAYYAWRRSEAKQRKQ